MTAFASNFTSLFLFRLIVGYGVGGDYTTSAAITSEYANKRSRERLVGSVLAMQGLGLLAGPAIASIFLGVGVPGGIAWRIMLGLGAVPAASVIYLRRKIRETPRYTLSVKGDLATTATTVAWVTGGQASPLGDSSTPDRAASSHTTSRPRARLTSKPLLLRLIGTAGSWFLLDVAFYGKLGLEPAHPEAAPTNGLSAWRRQHRPPAPEPVARAIPSPTSTTSVHRLSIEQLRLLDLHRGRPRRTADGVPREDHRALCARLGPRLDGDPPRVGHHGAGRNTVAVGRSTIPPGRTGPAWGASRHRECFRNGGPCRRRWCPTSKQPPGSASPPLLGSGNDDRVNARLFSSPRRGGTPLSPAWCLVP